MVDFPFVYNVTGMNLTLPSGIPLKAWAASTLPLITGPQFRHVLSYMTPNKINFFWFIQDSELTDPPSSTSNRGRFFHPGPGSLPIARRAMTRVPKIKVTFDLDASSGDPMLVERNFWIHSEPLEKIKNPYSFEEIMNARSDIIRFIEPIPTGSIVFPGLPTIPSDLYSRKAIDRAVALSGRLP